MWPAWSCTHPVPSTPVPALAVGHSQAQGRGGSGELQGPAPARSLQDPSARAGHSVTEPSLRGDGSRQADSTSKRFRDKRSLFLYYAIACHIIAIITTAL